MVSMPFAFAMNGPSKKKRPAIASPKEKPLESGSDKLVQ
jgi:hypothetical protein